MGFRDFIDKQIDKRWPMDPAEQQYNRMAVSSTHDGKFMFLRNRLGQYTVYESEGEEMGTPVVVRASNREEAGRLLDEYIMTGEPQVVAENLFDSEKAEYGMEQ